MRAAGSIHALLMKTMNTIGRIMPKSFSKRLSETSDAHILSLLVEI